MTGAARDLDITLSSWELVGAGHNYQWHSPGYVTGLVAALEAEKMVRPVAHQSGKRRPRTISITQGNGSRHVMVIFGSDMNGLDLRSRNMVHFVDHTLFEYMLIGKTSITVAAMELTDLDRGS